MPARFSCRIVFELRQADLHRHEQRLNDRTEHHEQNKRQRQNGQDRQRQLKVAERDDHQRAQQQHHGLQGQQETLPDEQADFFHIVGGAHHQLAGLVLVVITERQALNLAEDVIADVERHALRQALGVVRLQEREHAAHRRKGDDDQRGRNDRRFGCLANGDNLLTCHAGLFKQSLQQYW
jgi:hypothetical protein